MLIRKRIRKVRERRATGVLVLGRGDEDEYPFDEPEPDDYGPPPDPEDAPRRDSFVDQAKDNLKRFFGENRESVFYQRQLQVIFEKPYFHWVTARALSELVAEGAIASEPLRLPGSETASGSIVFYRATGYRYWKREADEVMKLVTRFSDSSFTSALGAHGETMFDAALPTVGFMPTGWKARSFRGIEWKETKNDLDRIFDCDGVAYGTEIKNTLGYIEKEELEVKVRMCKYMGMRPLFIVRWAPKSYVDLVRREGGFTLIFKYQLYPFGQKKFADEVRGRLRLPTDSPARIEAGTVGRFLEWHRKSLRS